ncbi:choline/ethanolamine kinase [Mycobacterium antarcticum]|uniref:phosphotransferase n=1 Tax=unclassified Mycolicibacterium TaxID=2636767 RepID=UPI002397E989|nr:MULTISPECIES: phosphotransferase [unclassified Mycolicibacterium]BDX32003.1 choline/ethanolamine kinase [Mycolicibacterium sp. TUM20985]GLP75307.1 choline/ethanolamine kinase [Mycolicibacterium sp. TUM20983]GLP84429.1 choline/ethanolamine kinase [Mycolicibacterium sp. TUM20984]
MSILRNDIELNAALDQLPALAGRSRRLEELTGGLTNRNLKITTPDGVYVARCAGSSSSLLAIDRDNEYFNSCAAERSGVGAPVIDYRPDLGILLIGYLDGVTLTKADFSRPGIIAKAAYACRTLHGGPRFRNDFDMFALRASYLNIIQQNGFRIPEDYLDFEDRFESIRRALAHRRQPTVPCNNDLLAANFVSDGDEIWLIDYEYSGNNDACFELGNIWRDNRLTLEQLEELVTAYYGRSTRNELARARLQGTVSQYGWTLWGCIQNGGSALDFDFWEWGMERYENAVEEFRGPDFGRLLDDVAAED